MANGNRPNIAIPEKTGVPEAIQKYGATLSPEVDKLVDYFLAKGLIKSFRTVFTDTLMKREPVGEFLLGPKSLTVWYGPKARVEEVNSGVAHELWHSLQYSDIKPGSTSIAQDYAKLGFLDRGDVVLPKHWTEQRVDTPLVKDRPRTVPRPPMDLTRIDKLMRQTANRRLRDVETVTPKGYTRSGVHSRLSPEKFPYGTKSPPYHESEADYATLSQVENQRERAKEWGMGMLDYDIPMGLVLPVVRMMEKRVE